jgi:hypothetical protein
MLNTTTTDQYIAQPATTPFRWGWDFNHWVPWMLQYPLRTPRKTPPMLQLKLTNPPGSLSGSNTFSNRFKIFYRSPMPITSRTMINTGCHTSFRWETKFGCTCINNTLQSPMGSLIHSIMDLTQSPMLWEIMLLSSTFPHSLACIQCSMWISFGPIFHHYWTP